MGFCHIIMRIGALEEFALSDVSGLQGGEMSVRGSRGNLE